MRNCNTDLRKSHALPEIKTKLQAVRAEITPEPTANLDQSTTASAIKILDSNKKSTPRLINTER